MPEVHVYRLKWWVRVAASAFLGFTAVFAATIWMRATTGEEDVHLLPTIVSVVLVCGGVMWALYAFQSTVTLTESSIELRDLTGRKNLPLASIRGRRTYVVSGGDPPDQTRYFKLEPDDDRLPALDFQKDYNFDAAFFAWFNSLPDLDALDKTRAKSSNFGLA
jgi:hypothetical protein